MFLVCFFSIQLTYKNYYIHFFYIVNHFVDFLYTYFLCISRKVDISGFIRKIKLLASEKKMSIRQLEETLGFGNGVINRWRKNTPGSDKLKKVADYFNISVDYLLGRTDNPNSNNLEEDEITTFFRVNTEDLTESEKDQLREELKEYLEFMKSRLKNK